MTDTMTNKFFCPNYCSNNIIGNSAMITRKSSVSISWANIAEQINSGYGYRILALGDTISFTLKNGQIATVEVVAFDPYWEKSVVFAFTDSIGDSISIMKKESLKESLSCFKSTGWNNTKIRRYINEIFFNLLPDDLANVIKERTIVQYINGKKNESRDKLWVPSYTEWLGERNKNSLANVDYKDVKFPTPDCEKGRMIKSSNTTYFYWLRSPRKIEPFPHWYVCHNKNNKNNISYVVPSCFII